MAIIRYMYYGQRSNKSHGEAILKPLLYNVMERGLKLVPVDPLMRQIQLLWQANPPWATGHLHACVCVHVCMRAGEWMWQWIAQQLSNWSVWYWSVPSYITSLTVFSFGSVTDCLVYNLSSQEVELILTQCIKVILPLLTDLSSLIHSKLWTCKSLLYFARSSPHSTSVAPQM